MMVALITFQLITIIVLVSMRSADAACSRGWKHYNGTCYMLTNLTEDNSDSANSVCTESFKYSELLISEDINNLAEILSGTDDTNSIKRYWVKCAQKQTDCWLDRYNSTSCISFSFKSKSGNYVLACSIGFVICRRSENIRRRIRRNSQKGGGGRNSSKNKDCSEDDKTTTTTRLAKSRNSVGRKQNRGGGDSSEDKDSTEDDMTTITLTTTPLSTTSLRTTSLSTTTLSTNSLSTVSLSTRMASTLLYVLQNTASISSRPDVTKESLVNVSTWIDSQTMFIQDSDPAAVFETCNDVLKGINGTTSMEAVYRIIEECEDYAVATVQDSEEGVGLYFKFEFLEVIINKSSNFFGGSFSYSSSEGEILNLNLTHYYQEKGNLTSAVALLFFKHEGLINQFGKNDTTFLASNLMTASFVVDGAKISTGINFTLNTKKNITLNGRYVCAFWKNDIGNMHWSEYGCGKLNNYRNIGECSCNHTTSFGVLVQVTKIKNGHEKALNYITYIGCGFSLVALLITIIILMCLPSLNSTRIAIHKNFVFSLIFAEIVFLVGPLGQNKEVICRSITLLMHYLWLAVFFWMLMEGLHLYLLVVKVYRSGKSYLRYYVATAWGCPFVIVVVSALLKWKEYESDRICWLSLNNGMIWAFLAPAAVTVVVNLLILIRVAFVVVDAVDDVNNVPSKVTQTKAAAKSAIVLAPILGTTWFIGVAANLHTIGIYLFTIFNSLQGVFVFVFYCVRNSEVRNSIDRIRQKRALTKSNEKNTLSTYAKSKITNLTSNKIGSIDNLSSLQMKPK